MKTLVRSVLSLVVVLSLMSCSGGFLMRRHRVATTPEAPTTIDKEAMRLNVTPITLAEAGEVEDLNVKFANDKVKFTWAIAGAPVFHVRSSLIYTWLFPAPSLAINVITACPFAAVTRDPSIIWRVAIVTST